MNARSVRVPGNPPARAARGAAPAASRRILPWWLMAAAGAALLLVAVLVVVRLRKPADPDPLRPARVAAPVVPVPSADGAYQEYRSPNVIIRFNDKKDGTESEPQR